ncbi:YceI family protein, partial [Klebsiella pneumoniae]|uniref:YceI family protein n=1 Tax=Klebsiella pneumoniae TaxID=573 RepID=UPI0038539602
MESDKFPRADFKGTITNIKDINFAKDGVYKATAKGDLTLHGVTKNITVAGSITIKNGKPTITARFPIIMKDFNIDGSG